MPWESGRLDCTAPVSAPRRWGSADGKQFWRHVTGKACTFRTEGRFGVADTLVLSQDIDEEMLRKYAVSVDANFEHPSRQGHRRFFEKKLPVENFKSIPGKGAEGMLLILQGKHYGKANRHCENSEHERGYRGCGHHSGGARDAQLKAEAQARRVCASQLIRSNRSSRGRSSAFPPTCPSIALD
jgi:hypothetical protein